MEDAQNYGTAFNVTYQTYKNDEQTSEETIPLKIGENHLAVSKEKVSLTMIYTRWKGICYKVKTTRKADFRWTEIKLKTSVSKILDQTEFFFTSEENSFGITNDIFMDGKPSSTQLNGGNWKEIYLSVEKNMKLACTKESFFEYVASRLSKSNFENCTHTCLRTSLPNELYPICPNYEDWYGKKGNLTDPEDDCNWSIVRNLIKVGMGRAPSMLGCSLVRIDFRGARLARYSNLDDRCSIDTRRAFFVPKSADFRPIFG